MISGYFTIIWNAKQNELKVSKVGDHSRGWPESSLFDSYYTKV